MYTGLVKAFASMCLTTLAICFITVIANASMSPIQLGVAAYVSFVHGGTTHRKATQWMMA